MTNCGKDILSAREGTGQFQRFIDALDPDSVKLNDFTLKEWMQFAYRFAGHVNYFNTIDSENPSSDWRDFFIEDSALDEFILEVNKGKNITPHLALFISFVKLLEHSQKRFNKLTKRHLDFFYHKILQIEKLPATPDKVHIIFELAKNSVEEKVAKSTELDGGKDANGTKRIYKTTEELIANKTRVAKLKNIYKDHTNHKLKAGVVANSYDGNGADFPDDDIKWWPFGYYGDGNYPELPDGRVGFALSGEIFELQEGERSILITAKFATTLSSVSSAVLHDNIDVFCSGKEQWLGPFKPFVDEGEGFVSEINGDELRIAFRIPREEEPVVGYNGGILGENYISDFPVCRVLFKTGNMEGFEFYRNFIENELISLNVQISVQGIKKLSLESDIGVLNAEKPFFPFGTQPVKRSNFYINYPELFKKRWENISVDIKWKNTPEKTVSSALDAFVNLYYAYRTDYLYQANSSRFFSGMFWQLEEDGPWVFNSTPDNLIVGSDGYFKTAVQIQNREEWETVKAGENLFEEDGINFKFNFDVPFDEANYEVNKNGPIRLSLNQSFLHELFPRIYALAFSNEDDDVLIPNEPYTPMVDTIRLDYTAKASMNLRANSDDYNSNSVTLFHEHPFGQTEEHPYLKSQLNFLSDNKKKEYLLPTYCKGGELYIGLENVKSQQQVSLLVQVVEGSENPLTESFTGKQKAEWSILCKNEWKSLDSNYIISNETDNFLTSGIVRFSVPREATDNNTILPANCFWVKVKIHKDFDAVCKVISIQAQAVLAEFSDNENDLSHLGKGLEAETITKLIKRLSSVKSVSQPYSSFSGKPEETDVAYYRRISERLRHKNRAITLWDYEHIILQEFPDIHKVKCLNHTFYKKDRDSVSYGFLSPGNVVIIVIPDIVNKNVFDIYQPRVSQATLNAVQEVVNALNSLHVTATVINPEYREVQVDLVVKFYKGFDENYYKKVLEKDITRLLSPWAFDATANISFGHSLHKSVIVNYIEKLDYVDFVEEVKLKSKLVGEVNYEEVKVAETKNPLEILVSARQHNIISKEKSCNEKAEVPEACQT